MNKWEQKASEGLLRKVEHGPYLVREYEDRLAIWRKDGDRLTWEELQQVKQDLWGDCVAIEVYPPESEAINLRHTRHLWWTSLLELAVWRSCCHAEFSKDDE